MVKQADACGVCGNGEFESGGLQWWPIEVVERYGWTIAATDPDHPGEGAVRLLVCTRCRSSYIEAASLARSLPGDIDDGSARSSAALPMRGRGVRHETMMVNPLRILIADDQRRARQSLRALLETRFPALEIFEAESGSEALLNLEGFRPHLVVMDARMPGLDGIEATRAIKSQAPQVKVIVLSMYAEYRAAALAAGADVFISKGEPPERLLEALTMLNDDDPQAKHG